MLDGFDRFCVFRGSNSPNCYVSQSGRVPFVQNLGKQALAQKGVAVGAFV